MISEKIKELISDAIGGDIASMLSLACFLGIFLCVLIYFLLELRAREGARLKKLFWALVLLIPVLGWLFYLAFYKLPISKPPC